MLHVVTRSQLSSVLIGNYDSLKAFERPRTFIEWYVQLTFISNAFLFQLVGVSQKHGYMVYRPN